MSIVALLALAAAMAADAVAVAAALGASTSTSTSTSARVALVLRVGVCFGVFQGGMPILGYVLGDLIGPSVVAFDHWIAFVVLVVLGLKAVNEGVSADDDAADAAVDVSWRKLLVLGVATSIDAFAVGVTLPMIGAPLLESALVIGVVTAVLSGLAVVVGRAVGAAMGKRAEVAGGLVLIALGAWILVDHLTSA
jgi:putative Mn2+ efflux pump MntP